MARIVEHLSVEELGARCRGAQDATEARHTQAIWLLAQGRGVLEVADVQRIFEAVHAHRLVELPYTGAPDFCRTAVCTSLDIAA